MKTLADLIDLQKMTTAQLFALRTRIAEELRRRQADFEIGPPTTPDCRDVGSQSEAQREALHE